MEYNLLNNTYSSSWSGNDHDRISITEDSNASQNGEGKVWKDKKILKTGKTIAFSSFQLTLFLFFLAAIFTLLTSKNSGILNTRSFTVVTGSMQPTLPVGSIVYAVKNSDYKSGDIITFTRGNISVTHRIVQAVSQNGLLYYQTKGDANNAADQQLVAQHQVIGKVVFALPYLGKLTAFLKTIPGFALFLVLPTLIFVGFEIKVIKNEFEKEIEKKILKKFELI